MTIKTFQTEVTNILLKLQQASDKQRAVDKAEDVARKKRRLKETIGLEERREERKTCKKRNKKKA